MSKLLIYVMPDHVTPDHFGHSHQLPGNITVESPTPEFMAIVTGNGGLIKPEDIEKNVASDVLAGKDELAARNFYTAITHGGLTEDEALLVLAACNRPATALETHLVDEIEIPGDHTCDGDCELFNSWEWTGKVTVNMPKARGVHMDKIRVVRNKELVKKDMEYMKALEVDDGSSTAIATEKQTLRDIPQTFDLTTDTPEELKEKWPEGLPKE